MSEVHEVRANRYPQGKGREVQSLWLLDCRPTVEILLTVYCALGASAWEILSYTRTSYEDIMEQVEGHTYGRHDRTR